MNCKKKSKSTQLVCESATNMNPQIDQELINFNIANLQCPSANRVSAQNHTCIPHQEKSACESIQDRYVMYDILIVGSGLTALYLCFCIVKKNPKIRICVLERENYFGGKLCTNDDGCEFGAARFFPSIHPKLTKLLDELNVPTQTAILSTEDMIIRGKKYKISDRVQDTSRDYNLTDKDRSLVSTYGSEFLNAVHLDALNASSRKLSRLKKAYTEILDDKIGNPNYKPLYITLKSTEYRKYMLKMLSGINYRQVISSEIAQPQSQDRLGLSEDFFNYLRDTNINLDMLTNNVCLGEGILLANGTQSVSDQRTVTEGVQSIVKKLVSRILVLCPTVDFVRNASVVRIEKFSHKIIYTYIENTLNTNTDVSSRYIFMCYDYSVFEKIPVYIDRKLDEYKRVKELYSKNLASIPQFRIFMKFSSPFWGSVRGRTKLSSSMGQLHFYSEDTIMFDIVGSKAEIFRGYFETDYQKNFLKFELLPPKTQDDLVARVNRLSIHYKKTKEINVPAKICWKYWENAAALWNTNRNRTKADYKKMMFPFGKKLNICYLNSDISFNHGWMEGCLEIVEKYIRESKKP
jgi:hypothetical protein